MAYTIKECFYTLQGEGAHAGRPAVFLRFAGCNLWSGRDADRATAVCQFCDTDFVGVGPDGARCATAADLAALVASRWPMSDGGRAEKFVVCTGGEPLLQLDSAAIDALHDAGFRVAVETNGTQVPPAGIDHLCVSPKANAPLVVTQGDELKLVFPQRESEAQPERFAHLDFRRFSLQPMEGARTAENTQAALDYCLAHPQWHLSLQTHKLLGIR
jgi:7-carboxy-7-deazaguanine synthase